MLSHFWLCGIRCRQCLLIFGFVVLAAGNALLLSAVCGIRYRRGPPTVRNTHSVLKTGSWGTRRIMDIRYSPPPLWYGTGLVEPETGFSGPPTQMRLPGSQVFQPGSRRFRIILIP